MAGGREAPPAKFADTAVPAMVKALRSLRVDQEKLYAVVVGGAMMFGTRPGSKLAGVGDRNVEAVLEVLDRHGIPVTGQDVGGKSGRSIQVLVGECRVLTKSGLDEPLEVGARPAGGIGDEPRRINVRPAPEPFPDSIWTTHVEGTMTA
jgi:chemotaxis receptor (MCP) glutamine deamidase CheD